MTKFTPSLLEKPQGSEDSYKKKLIHRQDLSCRACQLKQEGFTIATLNGSFDLLHAGHLYILFEAKKQADVLIVALNTDESIQDYKGKDRPIINLDNRLKMMAAIECVDFVTYFDELDPCKLLEEIAPNVHVNGQEYGTNCIESDTVKKLGARLHLVDRIPGLATSDIIKKVKKLCD